MKMPQKIGDIISEKEIHAWATKMAKITANRTPEEKKQIQQDVFLKEKQDRIDKANIPVDYRGDIDRSLWSDGINTFFDAYPLDNPPFVWAKGPTGSGKTKFCVEILKKLCGSRKGLFIDDRRLAYLLSNFSDPENRDLWVEKTIDIPVLLIDDFGRGDYQNNGKNAINMILEERLGNKKITLWTTNLDDNSVINLYGPQFLNRVVKECREYYIKDFSNNGRNLRELH